MTESIVLCEGKTMVRTHITLTHSFMEIAMGGFTNYRTRYYNYENEIMFDGKCGESTNALVSAMKHPDFAVLKQWNIPPFDWIPLHFREIVRTRGNNLPYSICAYNSLDDEDLMMFLEKGKLPIPKYFVVINTPMSNLPPEFEYICKEAFECFDIS